jgi:GNAT superfamily N-acetyltransferase
MDVGTYTPYLARLLAPDEAGGAWVSGEGSAIAGEGGDASDIAAVAGEWQVRAVAEAWLGDEPQPYGRNLNLSVLYTLRGQAGRGLGSALMRAVEAYAAASGCDSLMVTHAEAGGFYGKHGLARLETWRRVRLPARDSNTQFRAEAVAKTRLGDYSAVRGWAMPIGRYQSARQEWERVQPGAEPRFEAWRDLRQMGWRLEVRGKPAVLWLEETPREPGVADVHLWSPGSELPRQLVAAIGTLGAQAGFRELMFFVRESALPQLGRDWRDDGYKQQVWLKRLTG